ncbi:Uncharacterised protein [Mycobacteroides abscessus subsp. abscessus]|nr:Uncharacterised protein [Mycobacteroides abscessus subsp. abscessus]
MIVSVSASSMRTSASSAVSSAVVSASSTGVSVSAAGASVSPVDGPASPLAVSVADSSDAEAPVSAAGLCAPAVVADEVS